MTLLGLVKSGILIQLENSLLNDHFCLQKLSFILHSLN